MASHRTSLFLLLVIIVSPTSLLAKGKDSVNVELETRYGNCLMRAYYGLVDKEKSQKKAVKKAVKLCDFKHSKRFPRITQIAEQFQNTFAQHDKKQKGKQKRKGKQDELYPVSTYGTDIALV